MGIKTGFQLYIYTYIRDTRPNNSIIIIIIIILRDFLMGLSSRKCFLHFNYRALLIGGPGEVEIYIRRWEGAGRGRKSPFEKGFFFVPICICTRRLVEIR